MSVVAARIRVAPCAGSVLQGGRTTRLYELSGARRPAANEALRRPGHLQRRRAYAVSTSAKYAASEMELSPPRSKNESFEQAKAAVDGECKAQHCDNPWSYIISSER